MSIRHFSRALLLTAALLATAGASHAAWRSLSPQEDNGEICIEVEGQRFDYYRLTPEEPTVISIRGPRKLKITTRYVFSADDPATQSYNIRVLMDGAQVLSRNFRGKVLDGPGLCREEGAVAALHRSTLNIPTGLHEVQIFGTPPGDGAVAARFFRETRQQKTRDVSYAPEDYDAVYRLQFASGTQSTYYHFSADTPLKFSVKGPTSLKVYTRLDFDQTMKGSQQYSLELLRDGEQVNVYHYHSEQLSGADYVERTDIQPGQRKLLRISVPRGVHRYELRCVRPEACGISTMIRIPEADINPR